MEISISLLSGNRVSNVGLLEEFLNQTTLKRIRKSLYQVPVPVHILPVHISIHLQHVHIYIHRHRSPTGPVDNFLLKENVVYLILVSLVKLF